ncbi:MAG: flavodoxin domain-containing protein [Armatimonadota bacterium]
MRLLVAYETAHGSTEEIAQAMAETLRECGAEADVKRCREVREVEDYDAFIVGAPVWGGNWLKPARAFVARFEETLAERPVAYFHTSGAAGEPDQRDEVVRIMNERLPEYAPSVEPVDVAAFGGVIDYDRYNIGLKLLMKAVVGRGRGPTSGRHDMRDPDAIRAWTEEMLAAFEERPPALPA